MSPNDMQVIVEVPEIDVIVQFPPDVIVLATGNVGEKGPPGPEGPPGIPGGPPGPTGATGPESTVPGPPGPPGPASTVPGPVGPQGPVGPVGPKGDPSTVAGPKGDQGYPGPPGNDGLPGATGPAGPTGATGAIGPGGGDTGPQGPEGPVGPAGPAGPVGAPGTNGTNGADSTVPGPTGADGPIGPQGPQGIKGDTGAQGTQGTQGNPGATGPAGVKGDPGVQGVKGDKGDPGAGIIAGGAPGQALVKKTAADFDTEWATPAAGGGPSSELDYVQIISDVIVNGITEAAPTTIITGNSITLDGSSILVEFFSPGYDNQNVAGARLTILLYDGATLIGQMAQLNTPQQAGSFSQTMVLGRYRFVPPSGSHQFIVKAYTTTAGRILKAGPGGTAAFLPAFLRVTKDPAIGPQGPTGLTGPPGGASAPSNELDYAQITSDVAVAGTTEATATTVIQGNPVDYDGSRVRLEFYSPSVGNAGATDGGTFLFTRDNIPLGFMWWTGPSVSSTNSYFHGVRYDNPPPGVHTYAIKAFSVTPVRAGTGGSGLMQPATLRVTKDPAIGPQGLIGPSGGASTSVVASISSLPASPADGTMAVLRIAGSSERMFLIWDSTLGRWVGDSHVQGLSGDADSNVGPPDIWAVSLRRNGTSYGTYKHGPILPWRDWDAVGLKPQFRMIFEVQNVTGGTETWQVRRFAAPYNLTDTVDTAPPTTTRIDGGVTETGTNTPIQVKGDVSPTSWRDLNASIGAVKDIIVPVVGLHTDVSPSITDSKMYSLTWMWRWVSK